MSKTILITGAARGIGAHLALHFAQQGHHVIVNYRRSEAAAVRLRDQINAACGADRARIMRADVARRSEVSAMFDAAWARHGGVDVVINNAGINLDRPFLEMTDDEWDTVIATILTGTFVCSQEYARRYAGSDGQIITVGALTAISGRKNGANYCSARAGVLNLTRCMALELAPRIRVNCVTPGKIDTEELRERYHLDDPDNLASAISAVPLGRLGQPDDIFHLMSFLVNDATFITGQNFIVDGGNLMR
jgi:3-oxoacyl-[acyl-carrier protein] reductase